MTSHFFGFLAGSKSEIGSPNMKPMESLRLLGVLGDSGGVAPPGSIGKFATILRLLTVLVLGSFKVVLKFVQTLANQLWPSCPYKPF